MKVLAHPDPFVLEEELLRRVAEAKAGDPLSPVLVLVPTRRLADHVQRRFCERGEAWLNLEVLHFHGLARAILEAGGEEVPRVLTRRLLEGLARRLLRKEPLSDLPLGRLLRDRPGAAGALATTLNELREAGIGSGILRRVLEARKAEPAASLGLAETYCEYEKALGTTSEAGLSDSAGIVSAAVPGARRYAGGFRACLLHGVYELIGVHLDLLRELDRGCEVTVLLPAGRPGEAPAYEHSRRFAERFLPEDGEPSAPLESQTPASLLGSRLERLYDESAPAERVDAGTIGTRCFQGAAAETEWVVRSVFSDVAEGVPPAEIAVVARTLEPYATHLESSLGAKGLPWSTSLGTPLLREPAVRDLFLLLRVVADDFPRGPTVELLSSHRVRWKTFLTEPPDGDLAESWSRRSGILGGIDEWSGVFVDWASSPRFHEDASEEERERAEKVASWRRGKAVRIARAIRGLRNLVPSPPWATWSAAADRVWELATTLVDGFDEESEDRRAAGALSNLLEDLRALDVIDPREGPVFLRDAVEWLEGASAETQVPVESPAGGGVQSLDLMQARGTTFRRVYLIGFHSGLFPRIPREDPFLDDEIRESLETVSGRPLPAKREGEREERLLLAVALGMAGERLEVSWQRADESGSAVAPSPALRELARAILGVPDTGELLSRHTRRVPAHPLARLEDVNRSIGLLSPADERLLLGLRAENPESAATALARRSPDLADSLEMLRATESFQTLNAAYDGRISVPYRPRQPWSARTLGQIGRCPLQFFFERVLRVRPLEDAATELDLIPKELGILVHAVLERVYRALAADGLLTPTTVDRAVRHAQERLEEAWRDEAATVRARTGRRFEALWGIREEIWLDSLREFVRQDVPALAESGSELHEFEIGEAGSLDLGEEVEIRAAGRFDRRSRTAAGCRITDYKTGGKIEEMTSVSEMLKGRRLQVPLYEMLEGPGSEVEVVGVGPGYAGMEEKKTRRTSRQLEGLSREGVLETLRVLVSLANEGVYPLNPDGPCSYCSYAPGCRRTHPPTLTREETADDSADYRDLADKNKTRRPTLADVRSWRAAHGTEGDA